MNRFLPQLLSLLFYWYVQKLLLFVCDFTVCCSAESICQLWLFWRKLHTFMVFFAFVYVYDVCAYVYSCSCMIECVYSYRGHRWCRVSSSVALTLYTEACPPGFTWVLRLLHVGAGDLASGPCAFCNKHFNQEPSVQSYVRVCYL